MEEAFNQMRSWTRGHNRRLSQVARALADRTLDPAVVLPPKPSPRAGPTGRTTS
jgi:hypothetical protein